MKNKKNCLGILAMVLLFGMVGIFNLHSQDMRTSTLNFYARNVSQNRFTVMADEKRWMHLRGEISGRREIGYVPNYVWQDISRQIRVFYGNSPPRVGDVFTYLGVFHSGYSYFISFRISGVDGMSVSLWEFVNFRRRWR